MDEINEVRISGVVDGNATKGRYGCRFNFAIQESYVNSFGENSIRKTVIPVNTYEDSDVDISLVKAGAKLIIDGCLRSYRIENTGETIITITLLANKITKQ